ncbi:DHH family phosphoesterase [Tetragenococcus koreensis]|uniref:GGDEF domain-containing protein n=1 Tax=Tetragenococcus koreensis TaxID=290335 RepID=A0AAN4UC45_9ENTE|nr:DHH family phosphoesterase [Tetragenococcus koreensis]AYW46323.1 DHH family phosphoesterase [Tetragenococcus koreensis]MCF1585731.1 DHH family phosphoesterase [Tetragenococcus koreensis]MCF1614855.1 DHH family phosphoesterase [Tetragenococcus koreensis]MCF1616960.1 DHH family phosphoesterase [Tetragenococcus koreensis]MCF1621857.1 DHH family phosphoesterase [Tetragenococcus koreensis]
MTVIGIISLDNYDDIIDKMDDKNISLLNTLVTTMISDWANEYGIFYKRVNTDRYFFVASEDELNQIKEKKFDILQRLKDSNINSEFILTMSMGIAYGHSSMEKIGEIAQNNLDMALARGGDQVVIKDVSSKAKPQFFGGQTEGTIHRTRTRSRAMSASLKKIFSENKKIFVMGHRYPDMDAIGSAFGVATLAQFNQKECYVIIEPEEVTEDTQRCLEEINRHPEVANLVISSKEALKLIDDNSVLVMVDYNRPALSISKEAYDAFDKIMIIDHHRRGDEFPKRPLLTYIEPAASSASELVAELIQFQSNKRKKVSKFIAGLLLSGIYVDTKSFFTRTTAQTFHVASYLKNHGADLSLVRYLLSSDLNSYLQMSELVSRSEYVTKDIVVAVASENETYDNVTASKAADTLLSMNDIEAAFVITNQLEHETSINARSSGGINVQRVMEKLGGGGHFSNAATQIKGKPIEEVRKMLIKELKQLDDKE